MVFLNQIDHKTKMNVPLFTEKQVIVQQPLTEPRTELKNPKIINKSKIYDFTANCYLLHCPTIKRQ